jgi:glycosyltransferase involved in cell wall biosynthesis
LKSELPRGILSRVPDGEERPIRMSKKRLLFIPHAALSETLVTRGEALAQGLAAQFQVHLVSWRSEAPGESSLRGRLVSRLAGFLTPGKVYPKGQVTVIETPLLYVRRPGMEMLRTINTAIVNRLIKKHAIDMVVNQLALVNSRDIPKPHMIDIVDLPSSREIKRWSRQAARAAGITTITGDLKRVLARHGLEAEVIGNGADFAKFRRAGGQRIRDLLGLEGKFVIGYIGNHAEWSGLQFLLDVFARIKADVDEAVLLVVGPGSEVRRAKTRVEGEGMQGVYFTGPVVASSVAEYFKAIDVGVLPFELDPHAALSFPIKVIEYSAARKPVVASPLGVLKEIGLPNVNIVDRQVGPWVKAIREARDSVWCDQWDREAERYDWLSLSSRLAALIAERIPEQSPCR